MPGMDYEEREETLAPGDGVLFYSDGLVEAHNPQGEMFGFPRLRKPISVHGTGSGEELVGILLGELERFTGQNWVQEDDITLVTMQRSLRPDPLSV
jgi:serine phosphatase RsbU (regulator of sigma subunit)